MHSSFISTKVGSICSSDGYPQAVHTRDRYISVESCELSIGSILLALLEYNSSKGKDKEDDDGDEDEHSLMQFLEPDGRKRSVLR